MTANGGQDGETAVGTLEKAAYAFTRTYVNNNGNIGRAVNAANNALHQDRNLGVTDPKKKYSNNDGDRIETKPVP